MEDYQQGIHHRHVVVKPQSLSYYWYLLECPEMPAWAHLPLGSFLIGCLSWMVAVGWRKEKELKKEQGFKKNRYISGELRRWGNYLCLLEITSQNYMI